MMLQTHKLSLNQQSVFGDAENFVNSLRLEIQEYGALLRLLDTQQKSIVANETSLLAEQITKIDQQFEVAALRRKERESLFLDVLQNLGINELKPLRAVIQFFPVHIQPLLKGIADEMVATIANIEYKSRQNFLLLNKTLEVTDQWLSSLNQQPNTKTYNKKGLKKEKHNTQLRIQTTA